MVPNRFDASYQPSNPYPVLDGVGRVTALAPVINESDDVQLPLVALLYAYSNVKVVAVVTEAFEDSSLDE